MNRSPTNPPNSAPGSSAKKPERRWLYGFPPQDGQFHWLSTGRSPLMRSLIFYIWDYPLTSQGKLLMVGLTFALLAGSVTVETPIYNLAVYLMAMVLSASTIGSFFRLARVTVTGKMPERIKVGGRLRGRFLIQHHGWPLLGTGTLWKWPVYDVGVGCFQPPPSWVTIRNERTFERLGAGESVSMEIELIPRNRGVYPLPPVRVFSTFPFNVGRNELARCPLGSVLVLPAFHPLKAVRLESGQRDQPGGIGGASRVGESAEFLGNREYVPGDSARRIDFRSWARLAKPVVKEFQAAYFSRVAVVIDTFAPKSGRGAIPEKDLEATVGLAAAVAETVSRGGPVLDLFAVGAEVQRFGAEYGHGPLEIVLDLLAALQTTAIDPVPELMTVLQGEFARLSDCLIVLHDWDGRYAPLIQEAEAAGCRVKVLLVRSRPPTLPFVLAEGIGVILDPADVAAGRIDEV